MRSYRKELWFNVPGRRAFINITRQVEDCLRESGVMEGLALVNAMHITASVFINDDESGLHQDYEEFLEALAPHEPVSRYKHNLTGEDNGDAHIKRQVMGREVVVAITNGKLDFGPWSRFSTENSTEAAGNGCWLRLSGNRTEPARFRDGTRLSCGSALSNAIRFIPSPLQV